jgi:hypothetical protein
MEYVLLGVRNVFGVVGVWLDVWFEVWVLYGYVEFSCMWLGVDVA